MKLHRQLVAGFLAVAVFASLASAAVAASSTARVKFVLFSDIYLMSEQRLADGQVRGGFARLAALVKAERATGEPVIVAHAGDTLSPSLMSGFDRGAHIIALTNLIAPDVFVPGNHEFDFGKDVFLQRMAEATFPLYAANLRAPDGLPIPGFRDRSILTINGIKIGLTGATFEETPKVSSSEDLKFHPTIATMKAQSQALRQDGADFVVAVVHSSRGEDYALNATGALDLILTGHDHDLFVNFDERSAIVESSSDANRVVVVDATIQISERDGKRIMTWSPQFRLIDTATVAPDPEVAAAVAKYEQEFSREMDVTLGSTAVELDSRNTTVRTREAAIGNLLADAMRASAGTQIAITNGGTIRAGRVYPAGSAITRRNVLEELPFSNRLVSLEITGKELKRAMENGIQFLPDAAGRFPQISGMAVVADISRPRGERIVSILVGKEPLDETKTYTVATNDFLARGGDGYDMLRDAKHLLKVDESPLIANEVMAYVRRTGTLRTTVDGRILFK